MGIAFVHEHGILAEDEREPIERSHYPRLGELGRDEVQALARWLRERRNRARDMIRDRRRARRGKGGGGGGANSERGLAAKKQVYARALARVNARLDLLVNEVRIARNAARLRKALERNQARPQHHPGSGASADAGMSSRPNRKVRPTIHGARIGSVSQQGKTAQAMRDARG